MLRLAIGGGVGARWAGLVAIAGALFMLPAALSAGDALSVDIGKALVEEGLVGATWALVTPEGSTVGAAGLNDVSRSLPMSPTDRVQVGSVAKTLVATGVLRLVTEGRVALDAPLARYLPQAPIDNPWEPASPLTVRHLMDHTSGLDDARLWQVFSLRARPDAPLIDGLVHEGGLLRVRHRPGDRFSYSNTGYTLLGMLIEAVTGRRYEAWLDAELLAPLGMNRSTFAFTTQAGAQGDPTLAMGHFDRETPSAALPWRLRPASQFTTTAGDMARLARFLMSDGRVQGRMLIERSLLRAMAVPTTTEAAKAGLSAGYALGLARRDRHGVVGNCHLGNLGTFRAALCLYPAQQRAFFIAYNSDDETANFDRIDALLVRALGMPAPPEPKVGAPDVDPGSWSGLYHARPNRFAQFAYLDELLGVTRVRWDGEALTVTPMLGTARRLVPAGGGLFRAADRREPSHVLLRSADGRWLVADGLRTLERSRWTTIAAHGISAAAGLLGWLYLLTVGGIRSLKALRRKAWRQEPLRWLVLCLALGLLAPLLYLMQPFYALGDPTPANLATAALTGALPLALAAAGLSHVRAGLGTAVARVDMLALAGALQWCAVLAAWGMLPLLLWR